MKYLKYGVVLFLLAQSCKVVPPGSTAIQDTSAVESTGPKIIIEPIPDTVEIEVFRLLKDSIRIVGVGDIMMGTNFPNAKYLPPNDGRSLLEPVREILQNGEITFGNLEGVVLDSGGTQKKCKNPDLCYLFRTPEAYAQNLVNAGFNLLSTANNHAGDFGDEGRESTMGILDSLGIHHAGLSQRPFAVFMLDHIRYGFAAFSPNAGTMSIHDSIEARRIVSHLDSIADIVIVSFHAGAEGNKHQHVTRHYESFYGENRGNVYQFAHDMVDHGADVIFGHGPHITRAIEVYDHRFIAYSLGNFCTFARFNLRNENGYAPIIDLQVNSSGEFLSGRVIPIIQYGRGGPSIDKQNRAVEKIRELTAADFPESQIKIDPSGLINYIQD